MTTTDDNNPLSPTDSARANIWRGILIMGAGFFAYTLADMLAKVLSADFHPVQIAWFRQLGLGFGVLYLLAVRGLIVFKTQRLSLQIVRGLINAATPVLFTIAVSQIALADATAVTFVAPFIVVILGALILNERISRKQFYGIAGAFLGTLIIIRPGMGVFQTGTLLVLLAASAFAMRQIISRLVAGLDPSSTTVAYGGTVSILALSLLLPLYWETPATLSQMGLLFMAAVAAGLGEFCIIRALDITFAVVLAPIQYTMILWSSLWGWLVFADLPDLWTLTGASVIIVSGLLTSGAMRYLSLSNLRKKPK